MPADDPKQPEPVTFDELARTRKLLQEFCPIHIPSVELFLSKDFPIFKLDDQESEPTKFRHITSSATCYASIEDCPDKFRPEEQKDAKDFEALGRTFSQTAIALPLKQWESEGAAGIYCSCRGLPYVLSKIDSWTPIINDHLDRIFYQMQREPDRFAIGEAARAENKSTSTDSNVIGAVKEDGVDETKSWYKPNAYHTYWALELLRVLGKFEHTKEYKDSVQIANAMSRALQMRHWARQQLGYQVALHSAGSSVLDSDQLAWSLALLISQPQVYQSNLAEQDFLRQAFRCLFSTQEKVGTWRHYGPLFHYPRAGNAYCFVFETFARILTEALRPEAEVVRNILKQYFAELVKLWQYAISTETKRDRGKLAWSSGHRNKPNLESWATASVFAYAQALRRIVGIWTRDEALRTLNYKKTFPTKQAALGRVVERANTWTHADLADHIAAMFINPVSDGSYSEQSDPDEPVIARNFACSAILFGPPGTSKTALVTAIAGALGWKYVELHPSHFVADGLPEVQHTADIIFRKLMELDHAVVLFDEIDELVRERDIEPDQFGRFLTTSMLPRLAELWQARKVMYFVATNHIEYFDRAVTRSGRFDAIVFIGPPSFETKMAAITEILQKRYGLTVQVDASLTKDVIDQAMPMNECSAIEKETNKENRKALKEAPLPKANALAKLALFRWDELSKLAVHLAPIVSGSSLGKDTLEEALQQMNDGKSRSIGEYCRFASDPMSYERFDASRDAVWIITDIEGIDDLGDKSVLPVTKGSDGNYRINIPLGERASVVGYQVEPVNIDGKPVPGNIRLRKPRK